MKIKLLKICGGLTLMVPLWYLTAIFRYLPQKSIDYSPSNMQSACFYYLSIELFLSIGLFIVVIGGNYIEELIKRRKVSVGGLILDDVNALKPDVVEKKGHGWMLRLSLFNIIIPLVLLAGFFSIDKWILIVAFGMVWAVIKLFTGFVFLRSGAIG